MGNLCSECEKIDITLRLRPITRNAGVGAVNPKLKRLITAAMRIGVRTEYGYYRRHASNERVFIGPSARLDKAKSLVQLGRRWTLGNTIEDGRQRVVSSFREALHDVVQRYISCVTFYRRRWRPWGRMETPIFGETARQFYLHLRLLLRSRSEAPYFPSSQEQSECRRMCGYQHVALTGSLTSTAEPTPVLAVMRMVRMLPLS